MMRIVGGPPLISIESNKTYLKQYYISIPNSLHIFEPFSDSFIKAVKNTILEKNPTKQNPLEKSPTRTTPPLVESNETDDDGELMFVLEL